MEIRTVIIFLLFGLCAAQRKVSVQEGPLHRAEGYEITILCNVSGYQGSSEQNFQWSFYGLNKRTTEIQIVSTSDPNFPYAVYGQRVRKNEIYIERLSGDSVLLHITKLQKTDEGEYECHTPSTDEKYFGSYTDKMNLTVIPDTLTATMPSQTLNKIEGEPLELICSANKETSQHTHLSITWYLQKESKKEQIISLSKDFVLQSGSTFTQRLSDGDIRLDRTGQTSYRLSIYHLQPSDTGKYFCEATEWIQDPDKSWYNIAKTESEKTTVNVKAIGKDFTVYINSAQSTLTTGDNLEVYCTVEAQNIPDRHFSVAWFVNNALVATFGQNGVAVFEDAYKGRESLDMLKIAKLNDMKYMLKIRNVELKDSGIYQCKITEMEKTVHGIFSLKTQQSAPFSITVKAIESNFKAVLTASTTTVVEGEPFVFTCSANERRSFLSVTWSFVNNSQRYDVGQMNYDGMSKLGPLYQNRGGRGGIQMEKIDQKTFVLRFHKSAASDSGQYECSLSEWISDTDKIEKKNEDSKSISVKVTLLSSIVKKLVLITRKPSIKYNETTRLICTLSMKNSSKMLIPVAVTWKFKMSNQAAYQNVVTITQNGDIQWTDKHLILKQKAIVEKQDLSSTLNISRASETEAGSYQCMMELMGDSVSGNIKSMVTFSSNELQIKFTKTASTLAIQEAKDVALYPEKTDVEITCKIINQTWKSSQFSVAWYVQDSQENEMDKLKKIVQTDINNIVSYENGTGISKFQSRRLSLDMYKLTILHADTNDSGKYYCHVTEWLVRPNFEWYEAGEHTIKVATIQMKPLERGKVYLIQVYILSSVHQKHCFTLSSAFHFSYILHYWLLQYIYAYNNRN
ncbi:immunoglobulin superfamily member 3-like isoform X2 [Protopterus annectens]|uniref:immunoglobulin superfamily member 3-like isoform X2 n=1 Tax=Protopterus annectens TaxID=7888 RepID=UPI001CFB10A9|nr:immunoglobulin superfamily member 3-like isoform X2 [Protopterus annectens]